MSAQRFLATAWLMLAVACENSTTATNVSSDPPPPTTTAAPSPDAQARYRVTFDAMWSAATHPDRFPANPHFSPLIGATHGEDVRFWQEGDIASEGIERMAELGATSPLDTIIESAIETGTVQFLLRASGIDRSPGTTSLELDITVEHSYVTLVSMIAPSPDWFVGMSARNLLEDGDWPDTLAIELFPYDAGTDSGAIYTAPDRDTNPQEPIARIEGPPFLSGGTVSPLGTFTFQRIR